MPPKISEEQFMIATIKALAQFHAQFDEDREIQVITTAIGIETSRLIHEELFEEIEGGESDGVSQEDHVRN